MHFKQIEIIGFKSFADRTLINLEHGMTAVVGPNGCGKSNILDAMRWALGEQRPKVLRGAHMQDIIFNGSEERAPMGMAEVTLTFDNGDGALPIDFAEVQVTRRVYRSGESEYLLNKAPCRLRDVQELFMDTGIGTNAYSMIGQGKIDMVLSSKPEDRRFLFEEAAGIIRYKARKRVALRKLEQADQNLLRLGDIIAELARQMRSLKRQVNAAVRHRELTEQLKELEIRASWLKQQVLQAKIAELRERFTSAQDTYENKNAETSQLEAKHEELSLSKLEIDRALHARREKVHDIDSEMEKIERDVALIRQQIQFSEEQREKARHELGMLDTHAEALESQAQEAGQRLVDLRAEQERTSTALDAKQAEQGGALESLTRAEANLEVARTRAVDSMRERADAQTETETLNVSAANLEERLQGLGERQDAEDLERDRLREALEKFRHDEASAQESVEGGESRLEQTGREEQQIADRIAENSETWQALREQKSSTESRLASFRELKESYEGFAAGVRAVMQAKQDGDSAAQGIVAPLGELISAPQQYEAALEAALGGSINSVVAENADAARAAIGLLTDRKLGRVTFLPLDTLRSTSAGVPAIAGQDGVVGPALELVEFEARLRPAVEHGLGDTVIVESLDDALRIVREVTDCPRLVTLRGEVLSPAGAITGGSTGRESRGLLARGSEIEEMESRLGTLDEEIASAQAEAEQLSEAKSANRAALDECSRGLESDRAALGEVRASIVQAEANATRLAESAAFVARERDDLGTRRQELDEKLEALTARSAEQESAAEGIQGAIEAAQAEATQAREAQTRMAAELSDLRVQAASVEKTVEETERESRRLEQEHQHALDEGKRRGVAVEEFETNKAKLENDIVEHIERSKGLSGSKDEARAHVNEAENQRQGLMDESDGIEKQLRILREEVREVQSVVHGTEIDLRHDEDQLHFFQERILEEYHVALASLSEEDIGGDELDDETRDRQVKEIREKLERLGNVNLMAIEEFETLTERHEFLVTQEEDLQRAREALLGVIERIDATIRDMFLETFNAVSENFREYFRQLFNGGQARIYLLDEDDPLESGIEIEARPPGKKPQTLSLLSGGEQAMTAIALLFSIFKAKPSPFCVLDEVDAPLDDANILRFVDLLDEFSAATQFVVITHNKQTMARAGALYGVTQQERGVSQIVSVRFDDVQVA